MLVSFFFFSWVIPVSWLFSWQIRRIILQSPEILKARHFPISAFNNVLKCSMFRGLHVCFSPLDPRQPTSHRGCDLCVHSEFSSYAFLPDALLPGNGAGKGHRWLSCLTLNWSTAQLVVQGGKEGNRNTWSPFWNVFRSDQLILKEEKSIGIQKNTKPANNP